MAEITGEGGVMLITQHIKLLHPRSSNKGETPVLLPLGFVGVSLEVVFLHVSCAYWWLFLQGFFEESWPK